MAIQGVFCAGIATVSKSLVLKRQNEHISGQWWWFRRSLAQWPSVKVISCHIRPYELFAYNILQKRDRAMQIVSLCSTGRVASIDVHIDILRSSSDLWDHETWGHLRSKFDWPFGVNKCMFRCVLTIEIYWSSNYFSSVLRSQINQENHCCLRSLIWPQRSTVDLRYFKCTPSASSRYEHHARFSPRSSGSIGDRTAGIPTDHCPPPPARWTMGKAVHRGGSNSMCMAIQLRFHVKNWRNLVKVSNIKWKWLNNPPPVPIRKCCIGHRILNILDA